MSVSDRLKHVREDLGETQKSVSELLGISHRTWQDYENGKSLPNGKVLAGLAQLNFNVNWILTGEGPQTLGEREKEILSYEDAHRHIRERIKKSQHYFNDILMVFHDQDEDSAISESQLRSYVYNKGYVPTHNQLIEIVRRINLEHDESLKSIFNSEIRLSSQRNRIDVELLKCTIEAVEDEKFGVKNRSPKEKSEIISLIYSMNLGTNYSTERLKRFLEAVLIIVDQVVDLEKIPDWKLDDLLVKIVHHMVRKEDTNG